MAHGARKATVLDSYQRRLLTRAIDNGCPRWLLMTAINDLMMMGREFLFNCKDFINCNVNLCYHPATPVEPTPCALVLMWSTPPIGGCSERADRHPHPIELFPDTWVTSSDAHVCLFSLVVEKSHWQRMRSAKSSHLVLPTPVKMARVHYGTPVSNQVRHMPN
jgi:hypothetical protein